MIIICITKKFKEIQNIFSTLSLLQWNPSPGVESRKYILDFFELFRNIMEVRLFMVISY